MVTFLSSLQRTDLQGRSEQFIYWGLIASLTGFYWLYSYKIQGNVFFVTVFIPFLVFHWRKLLVPWCSNIHIAIFVFIVYSASSSFWTVGVPIRPLYKGILHAAYLWTFFSAINRFFCEGCNGKQFRLFMQIFCIGGAIIGIASMLIFYNQHSISERLQPFLTKENLIVLAQCLALSGIIGFLLFRMEKNYIWPICAAICLSIMLLSQTRGVLIGTVLALISIALFSNVKTKGSIGLLTLLILIAITQVDFFDRLLTADSERWQIYKRVLENIKGHEIFGMGLMTNTNLATGNFGYPHSLFLTTFFTGGIVGLVLLFILLFIALWEALMLARKGGDITGLVLAINGIGIYLFDGGNLVGRIHGEWLFFWLPIMLVASQKLHKENAVILPEYN